MVTCLSNMTLFGTTVDGGAFDHGTVFGLALPTTAPNIFLPPQSQTVAAGTTASFGVGATGNQPLTYQWFLNNSEITNATSNSSLLLTNVKVSQSGSYTVVITNLFGSVTSSPAALDVVAPGDTTVRSCTEQALRVAMQQGKA